MQICPSGYPVWPGSRQQKGQENLLSGFPALCYRIAQMFWHCNRPIGVADETARSVAMSSTRRSGVGIQVSRSAPAGAWSSTQLTVAWASSRAIPRLMSTCTCSSAQAWRAGGVTSSAGRHRSRRQRTYQTRSTPHHSSPATAFPRIAQSRIVSRSPRNEYRFAA